MLNLWVRFGMIDGISPIGGSPYQKFIWGLSRGLSAWMMIPGLYFSLYLIDYWMTVMDTPKY